MGMHRGFSETFKKYAIALVQSSYDNMPQCEFSRLGRWEVLIFSRGFKV